MHLAVKDDETTASAVAFLDEALSAFPFKVTHVLTDRGSCFTADAFEAACKRHGKTLGMGGVYDEVHAATYIGLGARLLLSGNDQSFLMAGATARAKFLRGLQPGS